jgi:hypothetical protein
MIYYKFVKWDAIPIENVLKERLPAALAEYDNGNKKPFRDLEIATTDPYFRRGGWCFPIHQYLKRYWVKTKYYGILEYYAVNKTAIRKELKSQVIQIVEI